MTMFSDSVDVVEDCEDVYYHFAGAISSMLHSRYEKFKQHYDDDHAAAVQRNNDSSEKLSIYKKEDKELIPDSLKYCDKGHMYFPCVELLPLVKEADLATKEYTNIKSFKKYGSELLSHVKQICSRHKIILSL